MKNLKTQPALLLLSALCLLTGAYGQVTLPHHVPQKVADGSAVPVSHYNPEQKLRLVLAVQAPNVAGEEQYIHELVTKESPNFHKFLTADEWNAGFAPSTEDEQKVVDWATSQGLTVTNRFANRLLVDVEAPAGVIEKVFGVTINNYQVGDEVDFSNDRDPAIPESLSGIIQGVLGLQNIERMHGMTPGSRNAKGLDYAAGPVYAAGASSQGEGDPRKRPSSGASAIKYSSPGTMASGPTGGGPQMTDGLIDPPALYSSQGYDYAALSNLDHCCNVHNDSAGSPATSSIGIVTFNGFNQDDVNAYFQNYGLAWNTTALWIDGQTPLTTPPGNECVVGASNCPGDSNDDEATLDTEFATATANSFGSPQDTAHVYVYEGANTNYSTFTDLYNFMLSDNHAKVLTTSWAWTDAGFGSSSEMNILHGIFNSMVMQGWTLIAAAGDNGSTSDCSDAVEVFWPAEDPNFLAAGGTELTLNPTTGVFESEVAWTGGTSSTSCSSNHGGGGGGVSTFFTQPSWQSGLTYLEYDPANNTYYVVSGSTGRLLPDISLNGGVGQIYYYNGGWAGVIGTSMVAPELAGFFARENTYLNYIGPICGSNGISVCTPVGIPSQFIYWNGGGSDAHDPFYDTLTGCTSNNITIEFSLISYCADQGYDTATGWGSANMLQLAWGINYNLIPAYGGLTITFSGPTSGKWYSTDQEVSWTIASINTRSATPPPGVAGFTRGWDSIPSDPYSEPNGGSGNSFYSGPDFPLGTAGCLSFNGLNGCTGGVSQGCHTVNVEAWDNQGDPQIETYGPLCYDTIPPVASASVSGTLVGSDYENLALVTLSATDSGYPSTGSGIANIYYLANAIGVFQPYSAPFLLGKNGVNTVKYYAVDVAGNISSTKTLTFGITDTTTTSIASSANPSGAGKAVKFTATVSAAGSNTATGSVTFYDGGTTLATTALAGGVASFSTSKLTGGTHLITASFLGSTYFVSSESSGLVQYVEPGTTTVISSSANPSVFGQSVTLTATISHGTAIPTGTVTFKAGATILATATVGSSGTATYTSSTFTVATHAITAVYSGDSNYVGSTSPAFSQVVEKAATKTSLASSVNPSTFGQSVTLTATVTALAPGTGTPTGVVQFYDGTTLLGSHGLTSGVAAFVTTKLATGTDSVTAVYVGSTDYATSTSNALSQVVDTANTKVTLAATPNPSTSGATVTFTATVAAVAPGAGTPTGTVTFMDGATELGSGTLNSSKKATFATTSLAEGTHSITAVYGGDSNFNADTSAALSQKVNP